MSTSPPTGGPFPFGRPVQRRGPSASSPRRVFALGAYPSALHVAWTPPAPFERVRAIAVHDEPVPFWTGRDQGQAAHATWLRSLPRRP